MLEDRHHRREERERVTSVCGLRLSRRHRRPCGGGKERREDQEAREKSLHGIATCEGSDALLLGVDNLPSRRQASVNGGGERRRRVICAVVARCSAASSRRV